MGIIDHEGDTVLDLVILEILNDRYVRAFGNIRRRFGKIVAAFIEIKIKMFGLNEPPVVIFVLNLVLSEEFLFLLSAEMKAGLR